MQAKDFVNRWEMDEMWEFCINLFIYETGSLYGTFLMMSKVRKKHK